MEVVAGGFLGVSGRKQIPYITTIEVIGLSWRSLWV